MRNYGTDQCIQVVPCVRVCGDGTEGRGLVLRDVSSFDASENEIDRVPFCVSFPSSSKAMKKF